MLLYKDGEISSSGYNYVIIRNLVGEGGSVTWVCADMGCGVIAQNLVLHSSHFVLN